MSIFANFGIDSVGEVLDPAPQLALGDAIRVHQPVEVFFSALYDTRFGISRKDLVEVAREIAEPETQIHPHPGAGRRGRDPARPQPRARGRHQDRQLAGPGRAPQRARRRPAAPLHDHLPAHRGGARGAGHPRSFRDPRRALPPRDRRDRAADLSSRPVRSGPQRDRALPDRRDHDLDLRRRAVEMARGRPDRSRPRDHRQACYATSSPAARPPRWPPTVAEGSEH